MAEWVLIWGIIAFVSVMSVVATVLVRRKRASRVVGPDEILLRAKRAGQQLAKTSGKTRQGNMRGGGTAADTSNTHEAARWAGHQW